MNYLSETELRLERVSVRSEDQPTGGYKMKRRKMLGAVLCSFSLAMTAVTPSAVMADSAAKIVTLGADLSDAQKQSILNYFKVNASDVEILYVTNDDERALLSSSVPLSQIGTRTLSCAYVKPTTSGGIKVRTANLNYVTCNMIATTLSTAGVKNCEVVAACPIEVSGTGALTGITMAYEKATGTTLDPKKKEIAVKEMVVTGNLANSIHSNNDAINIINTGKMEVVGNNIQNADEIYNVVVNITNNNNVEVSDEILQEIADLLGEIAEEDYDYDDMKDTLENVDSNLNEEDTEDGEGDTQTASETEEDEDSILDELDPDALGEDIYESSTEDPSLEIETASANEDYSDSSPFVEDDADVVYEDESDYSTDDYDESVSDDEGWEVFPSDASEYEESGDVVYGETDAEFPSEEGDISYTEESDSYTEESGSYTDGVEVASEGAGDELNTDTLDDMQKSQFDHLTTFCQGEYEGDLDSLQFEMGTEAFPSVTLDTETAEKLSKEVQKMYLEVLKNGTDGYVQSETDPYMTPELNYINDQMKQILLLEDYTDPESYLNIVSDIDRQTLFDDTMDFFEMLYNEVSSDETETDEAYSESYDSEGDTSWDESSDDSEW
jgi:uncharacterized protein YpuA (DUF1002 family)